MAHPFKSYEVKVLEILLASEYAPQQLAQLLKESSALSIEYTNYGFYVSAANSAHGTNRRVYDQPVVIGTLEGHEAGFVAFIEDNHLTLETHPWDGKGLPAAFRDSDVQISVTSAKSLPSH